MLTHLKKWWWLLVVAIPPLLLWLFCFHRTPVGKASVQRNHFTGEVILDQPGWHFTPPWVQAARIELRPMRVCITTAGKGFDCRLVQFIPEEFETFIDVEGVRYYWWDNRISFNMGYEKTYRGFEDLMRGHAYSAHPQPFLTELQGYE